MPLFRPSLAFLSGSLLALYFREPLLSIAPAPAPLKRAELEWLGNGRDAEKQHNTTCAQYLEPLQQELASRGTQLRSLEKTLEATAAELAACLDGAVPGNADSRDGTTCGEHLKGPSIEKAAEPDNSAAAAFQRSVEMLQDVLGDTADAIAAWSQDTALSDISQTCMALLPGMVEGLAAQLTMGWDVLQAGFSEARARVPAIQTAERALGEAGEALAAELRPRLEALRAGFLERHPQHEGSLSGRNPVLLALALLVFLYLAIWELYGWLRAVALSTCQAVRLALCVLCLPCICCRRCCCAKRACPSVHGHQPTKAADCQTSAEGICSSAPELTVISEAMGLPIDPPLPPPATLPQVPRWADEESVSPLSSGDMKDASSAAGTAVPQAKGNRQRPRGGRNRRSSGQAG